MIWESYYWRDSLQKTARKLQRLSITRNGDSERIAADIEQLTMIGFYIVRKLIEAMKLTNSCVNTHIPIKYYRYKHNGSKITHANWHHFEKFYDMCSSEDTSMKVQKLCNIFIHSFIFIISHNKANIPSCILITSDKCKYRCLYSIDIKSIVTVFKKISKDSPQIVEMVKNGYEQNTNPISAPSSEFHADGYTFRLK